MTQRLTNEEKARGRARLQEVREILEGRRGQPTLDHAVATEEEAAEPVCTCSWSREDCPVHTIPEA